MKLSTAIRIGSLTTRQIHFKPNDGKNGYCAVGAALFAIGEVVCPLRYFQIAEKKFPLIKILVLDPKSHEQRSMSTIIWQLNDFFGWTREQIADWVEEIENIQETTEVQPSREVVPNVK